MAQSRIQTGAPELARASKSPWWVRLRRHLVDYVQRARDRERLRTLDRASARDLLETRVREEAGKPFWRP